MTNQETTSVEIYIGSRVEHASEQRILEHLVPLLLEQRRDAVILANVNFGGHQVDLVLALNNLTLLIEAKGYTRPVSGGVNGSWQVSLASGRSKNVVNAYLQALSAKNALRDAMRAFASSDIEYYPHAAVVFVPEIPPRSSISSADHKVSHIGLPALAKEIQRKQVGCWSVSDWRAFARHHNLNLASTVAAACDPSLLRAERIVTEYLAEFHRTYAPIANTIVDFKCISQGEEASSSDVARQIACRCDALIIGPSGCGKSLLAFSGGVAFAGNRGVPIAISARHYEGSLKDILDREVGLMSHSSASELLAIARQLDLPTLLIVDGYNECDEQRRIALTRGISAISNRFQMGVLITSQFIPVRPDLLPQLPQYRVPATERKVKIAIASKALKGADLSAGMETLIDSVSSGLEAGLVGEVGLEASPGVSRHGLFDTYARKRLGALASDGVRALSIIAGWLIDRLALSLSVRDLDRLSETQQIPARVLVGLVDSGLLTSRGDRMSLGHEQFFHAFSAESVIRRSFGSADAIATSLVSPRHSELKEFIVGGIDDDLLLMQVLARVSDTEIVGASLSGRCGRRARDWAEGQMASVLTHMRQEAESVQFIVTGDSWFAAGFDPKRLFRWSAQEDAFVECLPQLIIHGRYLREVFDIVETLDRKIDSEIGRLRQQDPPPKNLRSSIFGVSYVLSSPESPRISRVCVASHSHIFRTAQTAVIEELRRIRDRPLSWGMLYLLISLYRHFPAGSSRPSLDISDLAFFYASVITKQWRALPYHLKLAVVDGAGYCRDAEEPELATLVEALELLLSNDNPIFNSMVFDVLQRLRPFGVEEEAHEEVVRNQLGQLLSTAEDQHVCEEAYSIYNCQFDHPYSNAYCEVLNSLTGQQRSSFLKLAIKGASEVGMFLSCLIREVAALNDRSINPDLVRWTALPKHDHFYSQDAIEVFAFTHVTLGRLGGEPPLVVFTRDDAAANSLRACGVILYWCNRNDAPEAERHLACREAWEVLNRHDDGAALAAVKDCADFIMKGLRSAHSETSLLTYFPSKVAELCREALKRPDKQIGYFPNHFDRHSVGVLSYAIDVLSVHGSVSDLPLLRRFVDHAELGKAAVSAIHTISEPR